MLTARRNLYCLLISATMSLASMGTVFAQAPVAAPPSNSQVVGRTYYTEGAIVVLLVAGALFSVCRSGRRM